MEENNKLKKAFTLVELIVVIAIVAILAAVSVFSYMAFVRQANESADIQLVKQLNIALQADETLSGKRDTMHDMLQGMEKQGFVVENLTKTKSGYNIVWDQTNNRFGLIKDDNSLVYGEETYDTSVKYTKWKFVDTEAEATSATDSNYSIYLTEEFASTKATNLTVKAGLDTGDYKGLTSVKYRHTGLAQNVVIRTNSAKTDLSINGPSDTIRHFDSVGNLHVIAVDRYNCFEENGKAAFTQVDSGKYKTTATAEVKLLFVSDADKVSVEVAPGTVHHAHAYDKEEAKSLNDTNPGVIFDYDNNTEQNTISGIYHHVDSDDGLPEGEEHSSSLGLNKPSENASEEQSESNFNNNKEKEGVKSVVEESIKEEVEAEQAACEHEYGEDGVCVKCGKVLCIHEYHSMEEINEQLENIVWYKVGSKELIPSCLEDGLIAKATCKKCGNELVNIPVKAFGHDNHVKLEGVNLSFIDPNLEGKHTIEFDSSYCPRCDSPIAFVDKLNYPLKGDTQGFLDDLYSFKPFSKDPIIIDGKISEYNLFDLVYSNETFDVESSVLEQISNIIYGVTGDASDDQGAKKYFEWNADFEIYFNYDMDTNNFALGGEYGGMSLTFKANDFVSDGLKAYQSYRMLNGFNMTYQSVIDEVKEFKCGIGNIGVDLTNFKTINELGPLTAYVSLCIYTNNETNGESKKLICMTPYEFKDLKETRRGNAENLLKSLLSEDELRNVSLETPYKIELKDGSVFYALGNGINNIAEYNEILLNNSYKTAIIGKNLNDIIYANFDRNSVSVDDLLNYGLIFTTENLDLGNNIIIPANSVLRGIPGSGESKGKLAIYKEGTPLSNDSGKVNELTQVGFIDSTQLSALLG